MLWKIYVVEDAISGQHHMPFFVRHETEMIRALIKARESNDSELNAQPDSFMVHKIGEFDDEEGHIDTSKTDWNMVKVSELKYASNTIPISSLEMSQRESLEPPKDENTYADVSTAEAPKVVEEVPELTIEQMREAFEKQKRIDDGKINIQDMTQDQIFAYLATLNRGETA